MTPGRRLKPLLQYNMEKCIIVAVADNWAIGKNNDLLWHLPEDLRYFKKTTLGCPVIMGYMTFLSLGSRPLPKRENIVISEFPWPDRPDTVTVVGSLAEAYEAAGKACEATGAPRCFVIGGGYTYRQAMEFSDRLFITHVHTSVEDAQVWFPEISPEVWKEESRSETQHDEASGLDYEFTVYARKYPRTYEVTRTILTKKSWPKKSQPMSMLFPTD